MELILGAAVSLLVQWLKQRIGDNQWYTLAILLVVSLAASAIYTSLVIVGYWSTVATVITTAGAFYAFVIQRFEGDPQSGG